jgi:hypothetical protein
MTSQPTSGPPTTVDRGSSASRLRLMASGTPCGGGRRAFRTTMCPRFPPGLPGRGRCRRHASACRAGRTTWRQRLYHGLLLVRKTALPRTPAQRGYEPRRCRRGVSLRRGIVPLLSTAAQAWKRQPRSASKLDSEEFSSAQTHARSNLWNSSQRACRKIATG